MTRTAVFPGTFDPITAGHFDLVQRSSKLFDELIIGIADSPAKNPLFSLQERIDLVQEVTQKINNIRIVGFEGLLIDFVKAQGSSTIVRGLRAVSDFEYEFQLAAMNRKLDANIETVFLTAAENHTFISASLVKEIAKLGGDVKEFVHPVVYSALRQKLLGE